MNEQNELSDGEVEEAFFRGFFYTKCKCGHYAIDHENGNGKCKEWRQLSSCNCIKFEKEEK